MDTKKLRQKILDLAIRGKLVPQNPNDEPASVLLERIRAEKQQLIKEGKIKAPKGSKACDTSHYEKIEGPFEIPESWEWVRLGNIVEIVSAKRVLQSEWKHEGIPFYRAREIVKLSSNGYVDNDLFISNDHYQTLKDAFGVPQAGDIMLSAVGTIGKTYIVKKEDCFYYKDASVLCLRNVHNVNAQFLDLILQTPLLQKQMTAQSKGTTVETITIERAQLYLLPIPPREEQIRIVNSTNQILNLLERINLESAQLGKAVSEAKNFILKLAISGKLVLQDSSDEPAIELLKRINPDFKPCDNSHYENLPQGWIKCRLSDVAIIRDSLRSPINSQERAKRIVKAKFLYPYYGATGEVGKIDDYLLNGEYLLLGEDGAPFLEKYATKAYVISGKAWVNNHAHILEPLCNINYLKNFLNCLDYKPYVKGSTRLKLTQSDMMKITIFLPPIEEQNRIVRKVNELLGLIKKISVSV